MSNTQLKNAIDALQREMADLKKDSSVEMQELRGEFSSMLEESEQRINGVIQDLKTRVDDLQVSGKSSSSVSSKLLKISKKKKGPETSPQCKEDSSLNMSELKRDVTSMVRESERKTNTELDHLRSRVDDLESSVTPSEPANAENETSETAAVQSGSGAGHSNFLKRIMRKFSRYIYKLPKDSEKAAPCNTESLHMYVVHIVAKTDPTNSHWLRALIAASVSLGLIFSEIVVCGILINEASFPKCSKHTACRAGEYCDYPKVTGDDRADSTPTCSDCGDGSDWNGKHGLNDTFCAEVLGVDNLRLLPADENTWWYGMHDPPRGDVENPKYWCSARADCVLDNYANQCDFYELSMFAWDNTQIFVLLFSAILLLNPLCGDIMEATQEEQLLNLGWRHSLKTHRQNMGRVDFMLRRLAVELVRLSLCMRKYVLPCFAAVATGAVIIGDDTMTAQGILFNFLSVTFVLGADDEMYQFLVPPPVAEQVENFVKDTVAVAKNTDDEYFRTPFGTARVLAISIAFTMTYIINNFPKILKGELSWIFVPGGCNAIGYTLIKVAEYILIIIFVAKFVAHMARPEKPSLLLTQLLVYLTACAMCYTAFISGADPQKMSTLTEMMTLPSWATNVKVVLPLILILYCGIQTLVSSFMWY